MNLACEAHRRRALGAPESRGARPSTLCRTTLSRGAGKPRRTDCRHRRISAQSTRRRWRTSISRSRRKRLAPRLKCPPPRLSSRLRRRTWRPARRRLRWPSPFPPRPPMARATCDADCARHAASDPDERLALQWAALRMDPHPPEAALTAFATAHPKWLGNGYIHYRQEADLLVHPLASTAVSSFSPPFRPSRAPARSR